MKIVRESISFTRQETSPITMGVGKTAVFSKILKEVIYDVLQNKSDDAPKNLSEFNENKIYMIDTRKLLVFYEENKNNSVMMEILNEMMDKVLTFNPNKMEHHATGWVNLFFRMGREEEIWSNPKWITDYTFNEFRQQNLKRTIETTKKLGPNKAFTLGGSRGERELTEWAIKNGATNIANGNNEVIQQACRRGDLEIVKLLLASPQVDPAAQTTDGKKYKIDERQYCIRQAAKEGHADVVELLMKDKRVDPSYRSNWALAQALVNNHIDVCKLLVRDQRVRMKIEYMKPKVQDIFAELRRYGKL